MHRYVISFIVIMLLIIGLGRQGDRSILSPDRNNSAEAVTIPPVTTFVCANPSGTKVLSTASTASNFPLPSCMVQYELR